jgi:hypothetical protein
MASAIAQLIAQQQQPDVIGSVGRAAQTMAAMESVKNAPLQRQLQQQQIDLGQKQLAQLDTEGQEKTKAKKMAMMASVALALDKVPAEQRARAYQQYKTQYEQMNPGERPWPDEYGEDVQGVFDFAKQQVFGAEKFKTDEAIRKEQAKPVGPASGVGKLMADRDAEEKAGASPARLKAYDDAIIKARTASSPDIPAGIREYEYYRSLSPEDQKVWLNNKRGDRVSTEVEKNIFKASDEAQTESVKHENYMELARQYEQSAGKMASGVAGSFNEWVKEQTGNQDQISLLRKDWAAVKASEVVKNLPPGAASDADVALALAGFLPTNAKPEAVASFLRGIAKLSKINGEYQSFKANYLAENKSPSGMLKAWREHSKENVPSGSTMSSGNTTQYQPGQIIDMNGKRYRVTGGDPADPDVEEVQ